MGKTNVAYSINTQIICRSHAPWLLFWIIIFVNLNQLESSKLRMGKKLKDTDSYDAINHTSNSVSVT